MRGLVTVLFIVFGSSVFAQAGAGQILGTWLSGSGKGHVKIEQIGNSYHGYLIWLKEPNDENGKPKKDAKNPDPALAAKPLIGTRLLKSFVYKGNGVWSDGTIYDPENGKTYKCTITLKDNNTMEVRGYIGISLIGRTDVWKRVN